MYFVKSNQCVHGLFRLAKDWAYQILSVARLKEKSAYFVLFVFDGDSIIIDGYRTQVESNRPIKEFFRMDSLDANESNRNPLFQQHIIPVAFGMLQSALLRHLLQTRGVSESQEEKQRFENQLQDLFFNLESLVFLDGEHRADAILSRFLRWSGPGFSRRFFLDDAPLSQNSFNRDAHFISTQMEEMLEAAHYKKLPIEALEKALEESSFEKIFVRLQNIDFLNYYVRGSYITEQQENLTRKMIKRFHADKKWMDAFVAPQSVEIFEEVVVIVSELMNPEIEENSGVCCEKDPETIQREIQQNKEKIDKILSKYMKKGRKKRLRPISKRRKAIQKTVEEKMQQLLDKSLDDFIRDRDADRSVMKQLHIYVYNDIPETDLELLLPNAQVSLGVKEYIRLCASGTVTSTTVGRAVLMRGMKRLLTVFNPVLFGAMRFINRMNFVRIDQKYKHAQYMLKRRKGCDAKALSHLADDYENVLKREILLVYTLLLSQIRLSQTNDVGLTRNDLENLARRFVRETFGVDFTPEFKKTLSIMHSWGILEKKDMANQTYFYAVSVDQAVDNTLINRMSVKNKITLS
jgi:transcription termination factor NusB